MLVLYAITRGLHKLLKAGVGDFVLVDVKSIQVHLVARHFTVKKLRLSLGPIPEQAVNLTRIAAHDKLSGWHQHHLSPVVAYHRVWRCLGLLGIVSHRHLRACAWARRRR